MPGVVGPAAQTVLAPSRSRRRAARNAKSVPRTETRYGVNAARRFRPMPTTGIGLVADRPRRVSASPTGP